MSGWLGASACFGIIKEFKPGMSSRGTIRMQVQ